MNNSHQIVALTRCDLYETDRLAEAIQKIADVVQFHDNYHGKIVLLKPNLISSRGNALACTNCHFIGAVAACFKNLGAKVIVGDSPAFGCAQSVCKKFGIDQVLKKIDVPIVNFDRSEKRELPGGVVLPIAVHAMECDLFVGVPKIKAHNQMFVTLALKNIFGIVTGMNKAKLHMTHGSSHKGFAEIILDLLSVLPPHLHIADGVEVMHRSGPLDGDLLKLGCIAAAHSPVALDRSILEVLELDAGRSPLYNVAHDRETNDSDIRRMHYPLQKPSYFHGSGFLAPEELHGIRFNPLHFLRGLFRRIYLKMSV